MRSSPCLFSDDARSEMAEGGLGVKPVLFRCAILAIATTLLPQLIGKFRNIVMTGQCFL